MVTSMMQKCTTLGKRSRLCDQITLKRAKDYDLHPSQVTDLLADLIDKIDHALYANSQHDLIKPNFYCI